MSELCHPEARSKRAVRTRVVRAFLVEEQKIVKKVLKIQMAKEAVKAK